MHVSQKSKSRKHLGPDQPHAGEKDDQNRRAQQLSGLHVDRRQVKFRLDRLSLRRFGRRCRLRFTLCGGAALARLLDGQGAVGEHQPAKKQGRRQHKSLHEPEREKKPPGELRGGVVIAECGENGQKDRHGDRRRIPNVPKQIDPAASVVSEHFLKHASRGAQHPPQARRKHQHPTDEEQAPEGVVPSVVPERFEGGHEKPQRQAKHDQLPQRSASDPHAFVRPTKVRFPQSLGPTYLAKEFKTEKHRCRHPQRPAEGLIKPYGRSGRTKTPSEEP